MPWRTSRLGNVARITMGQAPPSSTYNSRGEGLPFFQGKAEFGAVHPTVATYCSKPVRVAEEGDILLSIRAPVGPVNISPSRCSIGRGLAAIRPRPELVDRDYLFYYLMSSQELLASMGERSTVSGISLKALEGLDIEYPELDEQRQLAGIVGRAHGLLSKQEEVRTTLEAFFHATMHKAFSKQLRPRQS